MEKRYLKNAPSQKTGLIKYMEFLHLGFSLPIYILAFLLLFINSNIFEIKHREST